MTAFDFADLSRERADDDLHGDEFRRRAMERADRMREVSDVADMSWPTADIAVERARPARRDDPGVPWWQWLLLLTAAIAAAVVIGAGLAFWMVPA